MAAGPGPHQPAGREYQPRWSSAGGEVGGSGAGLASPGSCSSRAVCPGRLQALKFAALPLPCFLLWSLALPLPVLSCQSPSLQVLFKKSGLKITCLSGRCTPASAPRGWCWLGRPRCGASSGPVLTVPSVPSVLQPHQLPVSTTLWAREAGWRGRRPPPSGCVRPGGAPAGGQREAGREAGSLCPAHRSCCWVPAAPPSLTPGSRGGCRPSS